ncbi:cytochrome c biogenesis CcdA family protein [Kutzneria sp. NPDC051319]|uniref:cytochrome c biogenesis CcdA family protein n=1 Tax=Kutzneria sp. NPDC051319 TaxID=3155047 RepID=UPI00343B5279
MNALAELATSGPLLLAAAVALLAGAVSFASPCCLPLVPGYLAYLAGLVGADAPAVSADEPAKAGRWRVVGASGLFVLGFTVVFTIGSVTLFGLTDLLLLNAEWLQRIGGVVTILMGLVFVGLVPMLQRDLRLHRKPRVGLLGAPVLGAVFGLGWTPCVGPTLGGVLSLTAGTPVGPIALRGIFLILIFCIGLGVPFVLIAMGARWAVRVTGWLRRHVRGVQLAGGGLLIVVGVLLVSGLWGQLLAIIQDNFATNASVPL